MQAIKGKKAAYFVKGYAASKLQLDEAAELGITAFRNTLEIGEDDPIEPFDIVAGEVPHAYKKRKGVEVKVTRIPADLSGDAAINYVPPKVAEQPAK